LSGPALAKGRVASAHAGRSLDPAVCEEARRSKDVRFDGLFFTAVASTRIYCRPVCPAPWAKRVAYFSTAAAAEAAGYRPCLRCRPELSPADGSWRRGDDVLSRALHLVDAGILGESPLSVLAEQVGVSERHLRRLFQDGIGVPPIRVHTTRRLLFAKQLLSETSLSMSAIAYASGFNSLRRFNAVFRDTYRLAPSDLRKLNRKASGPGLQLKLSYRPPFDFHASLDFLRKRALPGVESVDANSYARTILLEGPSESKVTPWLRVRFEGSEAPLTLELHGVPAAQLLSVVQRVRRMFDLDAEPQQIANALSSDRRLAPLVRRNPGLRLIGAWDGFELAVRAILGQQVSVAAARTMASRIVEHFGAAVALPDAPALSAQFPTAERLVAAPLEDLGITKARATSIRTVAQAVRDKRVDFAQHRLLQDFTERWGELPGIGAWTAQYIAMRTVCHPDAFPDGDLVLRQAMGPSDAPFSAKELREAAAQWAPWRAYAVMHLWRSTSADSSNTNSWENQT